MNLYNDIDPQSCKWLEELVAEGLIPKGDVLCADFATIDPDSVRHYTQRHWCCGIGGWPYALKLAGWPEDRPIDTASLPCQPFSVAGKQKGFDDERHIWPAFRQLVAKLRPTILIGEQVPAAIRLGWLDGVFDDLEKYGYACGALVLPACSVGAPHIRSRLFWVADRISKGLEGRADRPQGTGIRNAVERCINHNPWHNSVSIPCADGKWRRVPGGVAEPNSGRCGEERESGKLYEVCRGRSNERMPSEGASPFNYRKKQPQAEPPILSLLLDGLHEKLGDSRYQSVLEALTCFPLAGDVPGRTMLLKGAGNAIIPSLGAVFVRCVMEVGGIC